jgi:hypothetical protein
MNNDPRTNSNALATLAIRLSAAALVVLVAIAIAASWDGPQCGYDLTRRCGGRHLAPFLILVAWGVITLRHAWSLVAAVRAKIVLATENLGMTVVYSAIGSLVACAGLAVVAQGGDDMPLLGLLMALLIAFMNSNPYVVVFDRESDKIRLSGTLWTRAYRYRDARLGWLTIQNRTQHSRFTTRHVALHFASGAAAKISGETQDPARLDELSSLTGIPVAA